MQLNLHEASCHQQESAVCSTFCTRIHVQMPSVHPGKVQDARTGPLAFLQLQVAVPLGSHVTQLTDIRAQVGS